MIDFYRDKLKKSFFKCSFLSVRKERKEACSTKELLKFCFVPLRQNNSLADSLRQILSFNAPLHKIFSRNSFDERNQKAKNKNIECYRLEKRSEC